ncbi:hypothetical protein TUBRATIS_25030, partial [Tubulinosema ratisbonensis]
KENLTSINETQQIEATSLEVINFQENSYLSNELVGHNETTQEESFICNNPTRTTCKAEDNYYSICNQEKGDISVGNISESTHQDIKNESFIGQQYKKSINENNKHLMVEEFNKDNNTDFEQENIIITNMISKTSVNSPKEKICTEPIVNNVFKQDQEYEKHTQDISYVNCGDSIKSKEINNSETEPKDFFTNTTGKETSEQARSQYLFNSNFNKPSGHNRSSSNNHNQKIHIISSNIIQPPNQKSNKNTSTKALKNTKFTERCLTNEKIKENQTNKTEILDDSDNDLSSKKPRLKFIKDTSTSNKNKDGIKVVLNPCIGNNYAQCVASEIQKNLDVFKSHNLKKEMKKKQEEIFNSDFTFKLTGTNSFEIEKEITNNPKELINSSVENKVTRCITDHKNINISTDNLGYNKQKTFDLGKDNEPKGIQIAEDDNSSEKNKICTKRTSQTKRSKNKSKQPKIKKLVKNPKILEEDIQESTKKRFCLDIKERENARKTSKRFDEIFFIWLKVRESIQSSDELKELKKTIKEEMCYLIEHGKERIKKIVSFYDPNMNNACNSELILFYYWLIDNESALNILSLYRLTHITIYWSIYFNRNMMEPVDLCVMFYNVFVNSLNDEDVIMEMFIASVSFFLGKDHKIVENRNKLNIWNRFNIKQVSMENLTEAWVVFKEAHEENIKSIEPEKWIKTKLNLICKLQNKDFNNFMKLYLIHVTHYFDIHKKITTQNSIYSLFSSLNTYKIE